jgi:hypothetical protein
MTRENEYYVACACDDIYVDPDVKIILFWKNEDKTTLTRTYYDLLENEWVNVEKYKCSTCEYHTTEDKFESYWPDKIACTIKWIFFFDEE